MKIYRPKLIDVSTLYGESLLHYDTNLAMISMSERKFRREQLTVYEELLATRSRPLDAPMATYRDDLIDIQQFVRRFK